MPTKTKLSATFFLACMCALIAGCGDTTYQINPKYLGKKISGGTLAVVVSKTAFVNYEGNVEPEFGKGPKNDLITDFFNKQFPKEVSAYLKLSAVTFDTLVSTISDTAMTYDTSDHNANTVPVPKTGSDISLKSSTPDYILILDKLFIGTDVESTPGTMTMGAGGGMYMSGGGSRKTVNIKANVVVWDVKNKDYIVFGAYEASASHPFLPIITMGEWLSVSHDIAKTIFNKTPFVTTDDEKAKKIHDSDS